MSAHALATKSRENPIVMSERPLRQTSLEVNRSGTTYIHDLLLNLSVLGLCLWFNDSGLISWISLTALSQTYFISDNNVTHVVNYRYTYTFLPTIIFQSFPANVADSDITRFYIILL